ncbi:MAG: hypothetical protein O3A84_10365, partial [Proteobacteria bacterium]|nr:hypothetical protein [Pseudomonadota bacterium]
SERKIFGADCEFATVGARATAAPNTVAVTACFNSLDRMEFSQSLSGFQAWSFLNLPNSNW